MIHYKQCWLWCAILNSCVCVCVCLEQAVNLCNNNYKLNLPAPAAGENWSLTGVWVWWLRVRPVPISGVTQRAGQSLSRTGAPPFESLLSRPLPHFSADVIAPNSWQLKCGLGFSGAFCGPFTDRKLKLPLGYKHWNVGTLTQHDTPSNSGAVPLQYLPASDSSCVISESCFCILSYVLILKW